MAADLAVHHPARRHDVGAGVGLGQRGPRVDLEGGVVVDLAVGGEHAAVAVGRVLVDAQVGDEDERVAHLGPQVAPARAARCRRGPTRPSRPRPSSAGTPNRITAGMPRSASSATSLRSDSRVCCTTPGQAGDGLRLGDALAHEQRGDEVVDREPGLGDQATQRRGAAQPAQPAFGEAHGDRGYRGVRRPGRRGRRRVRSTSESTTRSAVREVVEARDAARARRRTAIPAAWAAVTPWAESSSATLRRGSAPRSAQARRYTSGAGLPTPPTRSAPTSAAKRPSQPEPAEVAVEPAPARRRRDAERDAGRRQRRDELEHAGQGGQRRRGWTGPGPRRRRRSRPASNAVTPDRARRAAPTSRRRRLSLVPTIGRPRLDRQLVAVARRRRPRPSRRSPTRCR